jgi:hypothetical protein
LEIPNVGRIRSFKFADDVVMLANSYDGLRANLECVEAWCERNGMMLGANKCAAMVINGSHEDQSHLAALGHLTTRSGERIPVAESYRYLGIWVNNALDMEKMVQDRVRSSNLAMSTLRPLLRDGRVPLRQRVAAVKAFLLPVVNYGAEVWGMSRARCSPLKRIVDSALRD